MNYNRGLTTEEVTHEKKNRIRRARGRGYSPQTEKGAEKKRNDRSVRCIRTISGFLLDLLHLMGNRQHAHIQVR